MKTVQLGELCKFINGDRGKNYPSQSSFISDGIPFINAGDLEDKKVSIRSLNYISENDYDKLNSGKVELNDILFCLRGSLGKIGINANIQKGAIASSLVIIRAGKQLDQLYLAHFLSSPICKALIKKSDNGSSQPNLSATNLKKFQIPLPPLETQKKIAAILDAADAYRQKTKTLIEKYDQLAQSLFLDMFGDPFESKNKFNKVDFDFLTNRITYGFTCPMKHLDKGIHILTAKNIQNGFIDYENVHYADITEYEELTSKSKPDKNDILITKDGTIGRTALFEEDFSVCINQSVTLVKPKHNLVNARYLVAYLTSDSVQSRIQNMGKGGGLKHLQITELAKFPTALPEIKIQNQFVERSQLIETQKQQAQASLQKAEDLFNSLLQRAFKGELVS